MTTDYKIEKNIPIPPPSYRGSQRNYPWNDMEVGDSFWVEAECYPSIRTAIPRQMESRGWCLATRVERGGLRIWRTA